jgi:hypothetical protein
MITERRFRPSITFLDNGEFSSHVGMVNPLQRGCCKMHANAEVRGRRIGLVIQG